MRFVVMANVWEDVRADWKIDQWLFHDGNMPLYFCEVTQPLKSAMKSAQYFLHKKYACRNLTLPK
jgi:hypothetical protein